MLTDILGYSIEEVNYPLKKSNESNTYTIREVLNLFGLKEEFAVIETIHNLVHNIKITYKKEDTQVLFKNLVNFYGSPTHFYDLNNFKEKIMEGEITSWNIKTLVSISYENRDVNFANNNVWRFENYVINLQNFPTIQDFGENYVNLIFTRVVR